jgi:hypothetical protein
MSQKGRLFVVSFLPFNPSWAGWFLAALVFGNSVGAFVFFTHVVYIPVKSGVYINIFRYIYMFLFV